mmetsp:Transcript_73271/g.177180  ORF Transcript_73271/g.177180 Transcript_73271/m.177180 type:complete len:289 (+) Transcript_73271:3-869(+)
MAHRMLSRAAPVLRSAVCRPHVLVARAAAVRSFAVAESAPGVWAPDKLSQVDAEYTKSLADAVSDFVPPTKGKGRAWTAAGETFRLASANGTVDRVAADLAAMSDALSECSSLVLRPFDSSSYSVGDNLALLNWLFGDGLPAWGDIEEDVRDRLIESEKNYALFEAAAASCGGVDLADETVGMLAELASQARLDLAAKASADFLEMVKVSRNAVDVTIVSAVELSDAQRSRVEAALSKGYVPEGQTAQVGYDVDPSILGGLLVHVENSTFDVSSQSLIRDMNEEMADA